MVHVILKPWRCKGYEQNKSKICEWSLSVREGLSPYDYAVTTCQDFLERTSLHSAIQINLRTDRLCHSDVAATIFKSAAAPGSFAVSRGPQ